MRTAIEVLRHVSFCRELPAALIEQLADLCWTKERPAGANIQCIGEQLYAVYVLITGRVRVSLTAENGRELILTVPGPGSHFNLGPLLDGGLCTVNLDCDTPARLLMLPAPELLTIVERTPALLLAIARELAGQERRTLHLLETITLRQLPARLAGLLLHDAAEAGAGGEPFPLTQEAMAARLGSVRETVSRLLGQFARRGLIRIERRHIVIMDAQRLAQERDQ